MVENYDEDHACYIISLNKVIHVVLTIVIPATVSFLINFIIVWLYRRYAFQIYTFFYQYRKFLPKCVFRDADETDDGEIYDAFVCFARDDEKFVKTRLRPMLEDHDPYFKLCVHLRDWVAGDRINDQIYQSVRNSRRTIIVLSHNFLNSELCMLEFTVARDQAIKDRANRIIVIMLEDIAPHRLTEDLRAYITSYTYIPWQDNDWFWSKLRYALPHSISANTRVDREDANQNGNNEQSQILRRRQR